jgi:tRNA(adenine34) deaminase
MEWRTHHQDDDRWMREALAEADSAALHEDVPVGCVVVADSGRELGRGHNAREKSADPTAHAEIIAIRAASATIGNWRLDGATVYVTLEPCAMCAGALVLSRVARLVFGCRDPKSGAVTSLFGIGQDARLNHRFEVVGDVLADECVERLRRFFSRLRTDAPTRRSGQGPSSVFSIGGSTDVAASISGRRDA